MVEEVWTGLPDRFAGVRLDAWVLMPNHLHGLVVLGGGPHRDGSGAGRGRVGTRPTPTDGMGGDGEIASPRLPVLGDVVGAFKSITTHRYTRGVATDGWYPFRGRLWQRNYYEHIIRNPDELHRARRYIAENPHRWREDPENQP